MSSGAPKRTVNNRIGLLSLLVSLCVAGCATTPTEAPPARIEIQDAVGFTIVEEAHIDGDVRADYERGLELLRQQREREGIAILKQAVAGNPHLATPHIDLGIALHAAGDLEAAEQSLKQALAINPQHPIALNELGIVYRKTGRFAEARQSYEAALDFYSGYHYARRNLAVLCDLYLADLRCALQNYEAYMQTVPEDREVSIWIADLKLRMEGGMR